MTMDEYESLDGLTMAGMIHRREVSPRDLMERAIAAAELCNPALNLLSRTDYDWALERADKAEPRGTFGALPFLLKDSGLASKDFPTNLGSRLFADTKSPIDGTLTERFFADGLIPFGRTAAPEMSMAPTTEAVQNGGPTRNPWNTDHSTGGSSGGAAVAVAVGIVPIAHASDGGGSTRIPAACCGIYGLKASRGLIPFGPVKGEGWGGLASDGVLTRTVRDTAAVMDGIAGPELGAPYASPPRPDSYLALLDRPFDRPLRIAKWTNAFDDIAIAQDCLDAVTRAEELLVGLGHEVVNAPLPPIDFAKFVEAQIAIMATNVAVSVNTKIQNSDIHGWEKLLEPAILDARNMGQTISAETYVGAINRLHTIARQMAIYLDDYDFVLTPTLTQPPAPLGYLTMNDDFRSFRTKVSSYTTFTAIINASGQPAASMPLHWSAAGLPIGVQLITRFGGEADLLRLSARLEEAAPWKTRRPPVVAT